MQNKIFKVVNYKKTNVKLNETRTKNSNIKTRL